MNAKNHWQSAGGLTDGSLEIHKHPAKNTGKIIVLKFHSALAQNEFIKKLAFRNEIPPYFSLTVEAAAQGIR